MKEIIHKLFGRVDVPYALPSRHFSRPNNNEYTWEDWERDTRSKHPFRYWLHRTVPAWFRRKWSLVDHCWYWLRTHTYNRYHILDLRSETSYRYKWGWIDKDSAMMLACFNLLKSFVEEEEPLGCLDWKNEAWYINASPQDQAGYATQIATTQEVKDLYDWWMFGRGEDHKKLSELQNKAYSRDLDRDSDEAEALRKQAMSMSDELETKDDEMLARLIKIRNHLWT